MIRDEKITKALKIKGWRVIRIWEHEIKTGKLNHKLSRINKTAQQGATGNRAKLPPSP